MSGDGVLSRTAMLFRGNEEYGIGSIGKLYAAGAPEILFVCAKEGHLTEWLRARGARLVVVPGITRFGIGPGWQRRHIVKALAAARRTAERLDAALAPLGIDFVHAHWYPQQLVAGLMRRRGYRSVWQINNYLTRGRWLAVRRPVHHRVASWGADLLLPASDFIADEWRGTRAPRVTVRNAAVPLFDEPPAPLPASPVRCLIAGRLIAEKGHHLALEAVLAARRAGLDVTLDVFGGPLEGNAYADELRRRAAQSGHAGALRLHGFVDDLRQRHRGFHLGLQCRLDPEPCSLWVCEAQLDGLPLLASATGGTAELIVEGESGHMVPAGDAAALAERLIELARGPERLEAMRRAAWASARRRLSVDRFVAETVDAYRRHLR